MKTIWKFPLSVTDEQIVQIPGRGVVLTIQEQRGWPCLWAMVDDTQFKNPRTIHIYGTGHPMPDDPGHYVSTFQMHGGELVFHVFEVKPA